MVSTTLDTVLLALAALAAALLAEALHARRVRRLARLAFGPGERPAAWVRAVPLLRALSVAWVAWGLATLLILTPKVHASTEQRAIAAGPPRHILLVLDVSPSMRLDDAGPTHAQTRKQRARDVVESLLKRVPLERYRLSVVAVYNGAKPVVVDTSDLEVVRNILSDLPMHFAFPAGQTRLFDGLEEAARIAHPWNPRSTTLVLISDGDTVPAQGMPRLPASIGGVLVVGVGDPLSGKFIDGRQSRQDVSTLRQIATRLHGTFHNGNEKHVPSSIVGELTASGGAGALERFGRREYALLSLGSGAFLLALLPYLLHVLGTTWRPGRPVASANAVRSASLDSSA